MWDYENSMADAAGLTVSQLKDILRARAIDWSGAIEKQELVELVVASQPSGSEESGGGGPPPPPPPPEQRKPEQRKPENRRRKKRGGEAAFLRLAEAAETMGVALDVREDDLRDMHRHILLTVHPDKNPGLSDVEKEAATLRLGEVQQAYKLLSGVPHHKRVAFMVAAEKKRLAAISRRVEAEQAQQAATAQQMMAAAQAAAQATAQATHPVPPEPQSPATSQRQTPRTMAHDAHSRPSNAHAKPPPRAQSSHPHAATPANDGRPVQFHEILAAAKREESVRRAQPQPASMHRGDNHGVAHGSSTEVEGGVAAPEGESRCVTACIDAFTDCVRYAIGRPPCTRHQACCSTAAGRMLRHATPRAISAHPRTRVIRD